MPAPNDVEMIRVFTRRPGGAIADCTFRTDEQFEVVVELEAGATMHGSGSPYQIGVCVRNLTDSSTAIHNDEVAGNFGNALPEWQDLTHQQIFGPYTPTPGTFQQGAHCYEVLAYLRARTSDPDLSVARSPIFLVYHQTR